MIRFIARRLVGLVIVLFCVVTITFFLIRLMPGGPFDRERKLPPHIEAELLAKYKLDGPLFTQYVDYLGDLLHGDLRLSTKYRNRSVNEILADCLPVSATLGGIAFCLATSIGVFLGSLAASCQHSWCLAILPVVSFLGPLAANLLTGSIVVESIFSIPGAGGFFVNSVLNRDGFLLAGVVIVYCALLVLFNLVADILYGVLDRRIILYD